jgi:hypothetical protein
VEDNFTSCRRVRRLGSDRAHARGTMTRLLKLTVVTCVAAASSCKQTLPPKGRSSESEDVKAAVEQFCKMDAAGRWLRPEQWDELRDYFTDVPPWSPPTFISVAKSYRVGDARRDVGAEGKVDYEVEVDYFVWGTVDSLLHFTRARAQPGQGPAVGEPVEQRTYQSLLLTDRILVQRRSGEEEEKKGALRWRMRMLTPLNIENVDADATLHFVAEMRDKSNDPVTRYNAERTLAVLRSIVAGAPATAQPLKPALQSPLEVAPKFFGLESSLAPDKWSDLEEFFPETPTPKWNKIHVVDVVDIAASTERNGTSEDTSDVVVSTNSLGDLDSSLRLSNYPSYRLLPGSASACYGDYKFGFELLLSDMHLEIARDGAVKQSTGPYAWKLEYPSFEPLVRLDTAIRYVTERRDKTTDPAIKKNADKTLTILKRYKRGKPLPSGLEPAFDAGGCSG